MRDKTNINSLVAKKLLGVATSEEERQLDLLLSENPELKSKIDKMLDNQSFVERYRQFASIDRRKAKRRFCSCYDGLPQNQQLCKLALHC